jgi:hypothetical protein
MAEIPPSVHTLDSDLHRIFGPRLLSLVAYGLRQHATERQAHGHSGHAPQNPIHTMAIVDALSPDDLRACSAQAERWHETGLATPLLLVQREFERALDAFPLEFGSILADHALVSGVPPFEGTGVDLDDVRRACEVQARSHLLHLREGYIETRGRADALSVLIVRSAAPLATLVEAVARLDGVPDPDPQAAARRVERAIGVDTGIIDEIVRLAGVKEISSEQALRLFPRYFDAVSRLVEYVDRWSAR